MNVVDSADLWYPGRWPDPLGPPFPSQPATLADRRFYVAWVYPRSPSEEQAPRTALHVEIRP